jgi:hypothetical protein
MRRRMDTQIFWVVIFSLAFWAGVWNHDAVLDWIHRATVVLRGAMKSH